MQKAMELTPKIRAYLLTELGNYERYKLDINHPDGRLYLLLYYKRAGDIVSVIDRTLECHNPEIRNMVMTVCIMRQKTMTEYAIDNNIDQTTVYRWRRKFLMDLARNMGLIKTADIETG